QHVTPGAEKLLEPVAGIDAETHLRGYAGHGVWRIRRKLDADVLGVLDRVVAGQLRGRSVAAGDEDRLGDELRGSAFRIEIAQNPIHSGSGERDVVVERAVLPGGVVVHEELQVAADDKG